ncbi:Uncharacterized protein SCF082_LOCUS8540 [Durusdinium trenchii]|uniref:Uncharacterized protein n=1 Tax=Durusdinium trenchii TaxID=1381693 RepID=A0ABP0IJ50_9DINO
MAPEPLFSLWSLFSPQTPSGTDPQRPDLPRSVAFEQIFNQMAPDAEPCLWPGDRHALYDLLGLGPPARLGPCSDGALSLGLWPRLVEKVTQTWLQLSYRWRPHLLEQRLLDLLAQQKAFATLGLAALEIQPAAHAGKEAQAVLAMLDPKGPPVAGLSATAAAWLRGSVDSLAEAVEEIFTAQLLGKQQAQAANWWLAQGKLGEDGTFLFSRFRGRPHPTLLHQSADATMSLLKSIWIDEKNMAEQSAEIQEQVDEATDAGRLAELLSRTAVDEASVHQMQSLALGLPWLPDVPVFSGIEASFTHEEIKDLVFHSNAIELLSDLTVLERVSHNSTVLVPNSSHGVRAVPLLEWYKEPVMKLQRLFTSEPAQQLGLAPLAEALKPGHRVAELCQAICGNWSGREQATTSRKDKKVFISLCPVGVDQRDVWKEPLALVVGLARPLPIKSLVGLEAIRPTLQSFWETATERLGNGHWRDQALRPDVSCTEPILAVWPLRLAGGASMMQDPHLIPYSDGTAIVIMDITVLKCRGGWTQSSQSLGGPALTEAACVRSIAAAHVAWQEWAYLLVFVGKKQTVVQGTKEDFLALVSPAWRSFDFDLPSGKRQHAQAAFGAWWSVLRMLWAEAGALLGCSQKSGTEPRELCLWAVLGRLADELRPWEDFVASDATRLLSASMLLGWLAMKQVIYCADWEDEESGEIRCECGIPLDSSEKTASKRVSLMPAVAAAREFLQLMAEIVVAGEVSNVQKLYTNTLSNEDWQVRHVY